MLPLTALFLHTTTSLSAPPPLSNCMKAKTHLATISAFLPVAFRLMPTLWPIFRISSCRLATVSCMSRDWNFCRTSRGAWSSW